MKTPFLFALIVFQASTAFSGVGSAYLSKEVVQNRDDVVGFGREYALGAAKDSANHAAAVAGATGAALTSAGVGFLLLGNLPLGATLIGMGSVEFAQMGANQKVADTNAAREGALLGGSPSGSSSYENSTATDRPELDPKLDKYLQDKGIDSDRFKELVYSGELSDPKAVLAALGENPSKYGDKAFEKAQLDAQKEFSKMANELGAPTGGSSGMGMSGGGGTSGPQAITKINPETRDKKEEGKEGRSSKAQKSAFELSSPMVPAHFIPNLFGLPQEAFSLQDQSLLFNAYLREQGIVPNHPGMNIFQMAHQSYRSFAKSRVPAKGSKNRVAKALSPF